MQRLEISGAVRPIYGSLGVKRLRFNKNYVVICYAVVWQHAAAPKHVGASQSYF